MNRTGLTIALAIAAIAGVVLGVFPQLELSISRVFYEIANANHAMFALRLSPTVMTLRNIGLWFVTALVVVVVVALVIKLLLPRRKLLIPGRAVLFLIVTMALGPGLLVNVVLKEHWGRPRPIDVAQFGGDQHFVAWWDPRGDCPSNCSFVSGDVSGAAWMLAPAALAPPPWRALAYGGALVFSVAMALLRMMAGGHFPSDTIFAGVFTFLVIWLCYALIYRWPRTRLSDESIERMLERIAMPGYRMVRSLLGYKKD
jgi:membrane-associated PAP2 superfamily phosphatase